MEEPGETEEVKKEDLPEKEFSLEDLQTSWDNFVARLKAEDRMKHYNTLAREFRLEDKMIILELENPVQLDVLDELKTDLLEAIREDLQNHTLNVRGVIVEGEKKKMIYTQREKFDHLAEKRPILKELKDRLGLDPDF